MRTLSRAGVAPDAKGELSVRRVAVAGDGDHVAKIGRQGLEDRVEEILHPREDFPRLKARHTGIRAAIGREAIGV